jgi:hypothetical protein
VRQAGRTAGRTVDAVRSTMPRDRALYYSGLGIAAIAGIVEWPIAAAIGAGVWLASRGRGSGDSQPERGRTA